jgi:hypothetical protein
LRNTDEPRTIAIMRAVLLALLLVGPSAIAAPAKKPVPKPTAGDAPDTAPPPVATHNEGDYSGVKPGVPPKHAKRPTKGTLSWIGFEAKGGGAEIFLQSIAAFEVAQHVDNGVLVIDLGGLNQLGQNTWREVDARFFDTPIARIVARHVGAARASKRGPAHGAGVEVRVSFKNAKDAHDGSLRTATEADGMYYAYLSFAGTGGTATPTVQEPEK